MSQISMEEKLADLRKVIIKLSEAGCTLEAENEKQSELLKSAESEIAYLKGKVNKLEEDNEFTINYNTELKEEKAVLLQENEDLLDENGELEEKIKKLEEDNRKLSAKLYEREDEKKSKKAEIR